MESKVSFGGTWNWTDLVLCYFRQQKICLMHTSCFSLNGPVSIIFKLFSRKRHLVSFKRSALAMCETAHMVPLQRKPWLYPRIQNANTQCFPEKTSTTRPISLNMQFVFGCYRTSVLCVNSFPYGSRFAAPCRLFNEVWNMEILP